jgi:hypothetical protein
MPGLPVPWKIMSTTHSDLALAGASLRAVIQETKQAHARKLRIGRQGFWLIYSMRPLPHDVDAHQRGVSTQDGDRPMFTKIALALTAAAILLGAASPTYAEPRDQRVSEPPYFSLATGSDQM